MLLMFAVMLMFQIVRRHQWTWLLDVSRQLRRSAGGKVLMAMMRSSAIQWATVHQWLELAHMTWLRFLATLHGCWCQSVLGWNTRSLCTLAMRSVWVTSQSRSIAALHRLHRLSILVMSVHSPDSATSWSLFGRSECTSQRSDLVS